MSSRRFLLLGGMLSVLVFAPIPLAAQQQVRRFTAFNCPVPTPTLSGWRKLEVVPGVKMWVPVELKSGAFRRG